MPVGRNQGEVAPKARNQAPEFTNGCDLGRMGPERPPLARQARTTYLPWVDGIQAPQSARPGSQR